MIRWSRTALKTCDMIAATLPHLAAQAAVNAAQAVKRDGRTVIESLDVWTAFYALQA